MDAVAAAGRLAVHRASPARATTAAAAGPPPWPAPGPGPLGGPGELILVAEELGVGLGARYAGIDGPDPGPDMCVDKPPQAKVLAAGRPTPLWHVAGAPDDRAVFAGEARGLWLWAVVWPEQSGLLMYDELVLTDLRDAGAEVDLVPCGALSPRQAADA